MLTYGTLAQLDFQRGHCKSNIAMKCQVSSTDGLASSSMPSQSRFHSLFSHRERVYSLQSSTESIESIMIFLIKNFPREGAKILNLAPILLQIMALVSPQIPSSVQVDGLQYQQTWCRLHYGE
ncbi:hypothetical protein FGO68_gene10836 [Halteria grandinella]|uniref:Uncharacterized protein n=1 Tax=Halteria grandinella TaxID=5974 RepID=A0A8J8P9T4_HALGN|nr:hypothetical protein FGO68_gene10836 [Halteria grandinella]